MPGNHGCGNTKACLSFSPAEELLRSVVHLAQEHHLKPLIPGGDSLRICFRSKYSFHEGLWRHPFHRQHGTASLSIVAGSVREEEETKLGFGDGSEQKLCQEAGERTKIKDRSWVARGDSRGT